MVLVAKNLRAVPCVKCCLGSYLSVNTGLVVQSGGKIQRVVNDTFCDYQDEWLTSVRLF
jgi:hypothetical protein